MEKTWSLGGQMATDNYRAGWTHTDGEWARNLIPSWLPDTSPFLAGRSQQTSDFKRAKEKGGAGGGPSQTHSHITHDHGDDLFRRNATQLNPFL